MPNLETQSLKQFLNSTKSSNSSSQAISLESPRLLRADLNGYLWMRLGSMAAYYGSVSFEREANLQQGVGAFLMRAITGELSFLTRASGKGILYISDRGKHITLINLNNETINIQAQNLLAFESSLSHEISAINGSGGIMGNGVLYAKISGCGNVAFTSCGVPITLPCRNGEQLTAAPSAAVAWSNNINVELKSDVSYKSMLGSNNSESVQMSFSNQGFVVIQALEGSPHM